MFTLKRASHPYQGDAVTALWSQLWAFLGWYNAVQLVPRYEWDKGARNSPGGTGFFGGLPGCLKKCFFFLVCGSTLVAYGYQMVKSEVLLWLVFSFEFSMFAFISRQCRCYLVDVPALWEKTQSFYTALIVGFSSYCKKVFNAIHLGSWMLIVPRIRHGIGNYRRRLGSLPPPWTAPYPLEVDG